MNALLSAGANPNLQGMGGYTPAAIACSNNQYECLCVLLDAKVDVNEIDESEWHLLHHCTSEGSKESLCELLSRDGCLLDHVSDKGYTPLMIACIKGDCEMIFELVAAGANCTIKHKRTEESALNLATNKNARDAMERGTIEMNIRRKKLDVEEAERNKYRSSLEKLQTEEETSPDSVK
jgi:ankyrin